MRVITSIFTLKIIGALHGCTGSNGYSVEARRKTIVDNDSCYITARYPVLITAKDPDSLRELNEILSKIVDYDYYVRQCEKKYGTRLSVISDYALTLETQKLLSIEFRTTIESAGLHYDTVYHSLVLSPKNISEGNGIIATPEMLIEHFDRQRLFEHVKDFNKQNGKDINLLAYKKDSNYFITWGIGKDVLLLYLGGEGEGFGRYKIEVPQSEFDQ